MEATRGGIRASCSPSLASLDGSQLDAYAAGILCESLPPAWGERLMGRWGVKDQQKAETEEKSCKVPSYFNLILNWASHCSDPCMPARVDQAPTSQWVEVAAKAATEMQDEEKENIRAKIRSTFDPEAAAKVHTSLASLRMT